MNARKTGSVKNVTRSGESERFTSARKASCATACHQGHVDANQRMEAQTSWSRQSSFKSRMISVSWGFCNPPPWSPWRKMLRYGDPSGVWPSRLDSAIWRTEGFLSLRNGSNYCDRQFRAAPHMFYETGLFKLVFHDLNQSHYFPTSA